MKFTNPLPPDQVEALRDAMARLLDVYGRRTDLRKSFPEAAAHEYTNLLRWASGVAEGSWEDSDQTTLKEFSSSYRLLATFSMHDFRSYGLNHGAQELHETFWRRKYDSYEEYLNHQSSKLKQIDKYFSLSEYDAQFRASLRERVRRLVHPGMSVLCLGARIGTEVKAFIDLQCFSVGIDISTCQKNKYVLYGDLHDLQFADRSVDAIYTNCLDHVFDLENVIKEMKRVLKDNGRIIIDAAHGTEEGTILGEYESFHWSTVDSLLTKLDSLGLDLLSSENFSYPWNGVMLFLTREGYEIKNAMNCVCCSVLSRVSYCDQNSSLVGT